MVRRLQSRIEWPVSLRNTSSSVGTSVRKSVDADAVFGQALDHLRHQVGAGPANRVS